MLITATHLTKYNNLKCIVDDVSFTINEQDKVALIGINGTGKSTLLKMIAQIDDYQGEILRKKDIRISYLPQNPDFQNELTVLKQVYEYVGHDVEEYEVKAILNKFGIINHEQKIAELSGGQQKRVALAITLLKPCDLLLLDEPTNHLDNEMIEYLEKYLMKFNKAIFMVTHDRYFLERITNKIFELDCSKIYEYEANYSNYLELKQQREEITLASERKRKLFLKKELEWVRAGVQARSTKSKDRLKRFEELSQQNDTQKIQNVEMLSVSSRLGKKTIELEQVSMAYQELLFAPFSYHFKRHDRVGILGRNGCGKSTLLNIIAGLITPTSGQVIIGDTIKMGYFKQGHEDMDPKMRVIDYIKETAQILNTSDGQLSAKQMCERFLFDSQMQYTPIERLSGGEKRRLYLLKILMSAPNVLLLDEPTNDLDIMTLQILEDYLDSFNGIIITVSHDRYFLDRICDELFVFNQQQITYHIGGYSQFIELESSSKKTKTPNPNTYKEQKKNKIKLSYKEKQELQVLEELIPNLEKQIKDIDEQMNTISDFETIQKLTEERSSLEQQIDEKSERWMELLEKEEQTQNNAR
ncbi:ABC-F family ATP-binding cassette domain-containing protein [Longibaculum muris]|uniref:ATP-binding cassette subfamily F protein uup n=1 Tax=Longibaculum muris TaxID=1796628 RepID=A0A4R3Z5Z5_9FIRM|nr:ABC-F family ATP-binding cassette domain-containing protein [Longibaculum muris]KXU50526.1 ABC transporter, ATP-binding protein [Candidatus Stoquefichus sp. KLE1796]MBS5368900.1 ABC-F family ATP-binding cassette domain-containing protein [Coprobacillus cateniformis]MCR1887259.1 ABC-F family ATP-binding cassette domain-containing protein [Longibaculum muris]TCW02167.1 ATP-binding cassette subfamily F protein uup [Longibaculum muris]